MKYFIEALAGVYWLRVNGFYLKQGEAVWAAITKRRSHPKINYRVVDNSGRVVLWPRGEGPFGKLTT